MVVRLVEQAIVAKLGPATRVASSVDGVPGLWVSLSIDEEPIVVPGMPPDLEHYTDPMVQALVLTAIVISFATTALFLVILLALRGLADTDHVDGEEERP